MVWRYLLNVYPDGLSGQERMDYMKRKTREYDQLKREWTTRVSHEDLEFIRGNVLKDVLRTDRAHPYYAGSEDSPHLTALTDLLTTFAITHPQVCIGTLSGTQIFSCSLNLLTLCIHRNARILAKSSTNK